MSARSQVQGERRAEKELKHTKHCGNYLKHYIAQNAIFGKSLFELCNALGCLQIDSPEAQIVNQAHDISNIR
jgi:hypothetical protein